MDAARTQAGGGCPYLSSGDTKLNTLLNQTRRQATRLLAALISVCFSISFGNLLPCLCLINSIQTSLFLFWGVCPLLHCVHCPPPTPTPSPPPPPPLTFLSSLHVMSGSDSTGTHRAENSSLHYESHSCTCTAHVRARSACDQYQQWPQ